MMEANELRLGNKVYHTTTSDVLTVSELGLHEEMDCYDPIPLTPEILEKCGFVKCNSHFGGYLISIGEGEQIRIVNDESIGWHYPLNGYQRPKANYLHQLQNLYFALTGQELNINL